MFDPAHSRLLHAVILSLGIHGAILLGVVSALPARIEESQATLKAVLSAGDAHRAVRPEEAPLIPSPASRSSAARESKIRPLVANQSAAQKPVQPPVQAGSVDIPSASRAGGSVESVAAQTAVPSSAPLSARDGLDPDDLRDYRLSVAIAARRFKRYPPLARERGWEGVVELALVIAAHRTAAEVVLVRSSGVDLLDRQAQEMLVQAARTTALPEGLKGRGFQILLPVQFSLDSDQ